MEKTIKTFKTHEPKLWQKFAQLYWLFPKSAKLDTFTYDGETITIKTLNRKELSAPLSELKIRFNIDNAERKSYTISHNKKKINFVAMPFMLEDEEWEEIDNILSQSPDYGEPKYAKWVRISREIVDFLKE